ncbi:ParA family protein, partial [Guyparkeria sp. 1SP6A2]|nr:ParA family protein [Guyparkeria sp. 1SP6A2]
MLEEEGEIWQAHPPRVAVPQVRRSKVVTIANNKGGVGKTTLTIYLASYFRQLGKKVLVIDLDYQGS